VFGNGSLAGDTNRLFFASWLRPEAKKSKMQGVLAAQV